MKKRRFILIYSIAIILFTVYAMLDVFVIPHRQKPVAEAQAEAETDSGLAESKESLSQGSGLAESKENPSSDSAEESTENSASDKVNGDRGSKGMASGKTDSDDAAHGHVHGSGDGAPGKGDHVKPSGAGKGSGSSDKDKESTHSGKKDAGVSEEEESDPGEEISADGSEEAENPSGGEAAETASDDGSVEISGSTSGSVIGTYSDGGINITVSEYREYDTEIYSADIAVSDPSCLKTAFAEDTFGRNIKAHTSETAALHGAVLAINGDFYGAREQGYVIRNGILYREDSSGGQDLAIYGDGSFRIINENDITAEELLNGGAVQVLSFGPGLVSGGSIMVAKDTEVGQASPSNPRTAIGIIGSNHYIFVVSDGRTDESTGLSLYQLAQFMIGLGVKTGYNLDGGGSSTLYFNGEVLNKPTTDGKTFVERSVSDIVYIGN